MKREPCTPRSCNHVDFVLASMDCERLADYLEFCECDEKHFVYPRVARLLVRSKVSASHVPFTSTDFSLCLQINMSMIEERIRYYRQRIATIVESGGKHTRRPTVTASAHVLFVVVSQRMLLRLETRLRRLELVTAFFEDTFARCCQRCTLSPRANGALPSSIPCIQDAVSKKHEVLVAVVKNIIIHESNATTQLCFLL